MTEFSMDEAKEWKPEEKEYTIDQYPNSETMQNLADEIQNAIEKFANVNGDKPEQLILATVFHVLLEFPYMWISQAGNIDDFPTMMVQEIQHFLRTKIVAKAIADGVISIDKDGNITQGVSNVVPTGETN